MNIILAVLCAVGSLWGVLLVAVLCALVIALIRTAKTRGLPSPCVEH